MWPDLILIHSLHQKQHHSSSKSPDLIRVRPDQNLCSIHLCRNDPRGISIWFGSHQGFEDDARSLVMDPWMKDPQNATRVFHHPWRSPFFHPWSRPPFYNWMSLDVISWQFAGGWLVGWFNFSLKFLFDDFLWCFEWKEKNPHWNSETTKWNTAAICFGANKHLSTI